MNILYSGGAPGADTIFAMCAANRGDEVYHFSFHGHKACNVGGVVVLSPGALEKYTDVLVLAGKTLGKTYSKKMPEHPRFKHIRSLLARNAWQIFGIEKTLNEETEKLEPAGPSTAVYAVAPLSKDKKLVEGGTGWAVAIATHQTEIPVYVFDLKSNRWHMWVGDTFSTCESPPSPEGVYTGIGSRDMTDEGIEAIGKLYGLEGMMENE
jgi:hypothetical protein